MTKISMRVISYQIHDVPDSDPPKQMHQVKLYGVLNDHGCLLEFAQPDNSMGFAPEKEFKVSIAS